MIHLYEIADDYKKALDFDIDNEIDSMALTELLSEVADRFEVKAGHVVDYMRSVEAEIDAYRKEEERLACRRETLKRRYDSLKEYLTYEMHRCEILECNAGLSKLKFIKNPWSVDIDANAIIPDNYMRHPAAPPPSPDKSKIADALKAGIQIDGVRLVQSERLKIS